MRDGWRQELARCRDRRWREFSCFFFFQAEDGIRDGTVTGVQTCALPIFAHLVAARRWSEEVCEALEVPLEWLPPVRESSEARSEERRVGKECRSRRAPYHHKKKQEYSYVSAQNMKYESRWAALQIDSAGG